MAFPIIPLALAVSAVSLAKNIKISARDQRSEDCLDRVAEGTSLHRDAAGDQVNLASRWRRELRWRGTNAGIVIDAAALGRIRVKRL
ncbi:hypothetical protein GCM10007939_15880 [Amylibacter marinus]|uniref:Secreted protein n=1 Tax=Amylibacter marinus TaxID=1475483 RepID=A0ABQ5VVL3_9RHOB|nr:hypothetical protein [Amylibacter marinus]GLQ35305.1 hypothetical protein GCM10007939_15880 [Amylibacter marinus]